jgi:hypothetical protein
LSRIPQDAPTHFQGRRTGEFLKKGDPWIRRDGWTVTIFPRGGGFKAVLSRADQKIFLSQIFPSVDEAKLAAYDTMRASKAA